MVGPPPEEISNEISRQVAFFYFTFFYNGYFYGLGIKTVYLTNIIGKGVFL